MGRLALQQGQVYYEHYAPGEASKQRGEDLCVLLSHGFGMSCRVWDNTVAVLVDNGYGVLTYDHRGCGASDKDFADVGVSALGDDVVALCSHLGLARVVLNGWSLGGAVVVDAAAKMPAVVAGLISTGGATPRYTQATGFPHGGTAADVHATVAALRADRVNFLKGLYHEGVFAAPVSDDIKQWCYGIALQASSGADASLAALAEVDQREALASLHCPSLFIAGELDAVVPPDICAFAAAHAQHGELVTLAGCGHAPFLEAPDEYHSAVLKFLAGLN